VGVHFSGSNFSGADVVFVKALLFCADVMTFGPAALVRFGFFFVVGFLPVLAHGMAFETFPGQDAAQVRMAVEADTV